MISFVAMDWMLYLFVIISAAGFAWEAAYGTLASWVKQIFNLDTPTKYNPILHYSFWRQLLGKSAVFLSPFILVAVLARLTHKFLYSLTSCAFCLSVWVMFALNFWVMDMLLLQSIILAPVAILFVAIIDRLRT